MNKLFTIIVAFVFSILPLIGFCFFAIVIFDKASTPYNYILSILVILFGLAASRSVFNMIRRRGLLNVVVGTYKSYELDNLEPTEGDGVLKLTAKELVVLLEENNMEFKKVSISIWGDGQGRELEKKHKFHKVEHDDVSNVLTFTFREHCLLKIKHPITILYAEHYIKILNAKEVMWQVGSGSINKDQYSYLNVGNKIKTQSNTSWKPHKNDLGLGMVAIYFARLRKIKLFPFTKTRVKMIDPQTSRTKPFESYNLNPIKTLFTRS